MANQIRQLDFDKLAFLSSQFHFQSVMNSMENVKDKMKLTPKVYLPTLMIQPGRLMNRMAQVIESDEFEPENPNPNGAWYDVRNLELIYLSLFKKSVFSQKEQLEDELFELKELVTDLSRKQAQEGNDKSGAQQTK